MKPLLFRLLGVVCLSLASGPAVANPMMSVREVSAEVTGAINVRLRFISDMSTTPDYVVTFGTKHSDWFTDGSVYSRNIGSGKTFTGPYQFLCDCNVPNGSSLDYYVEATKVTVTPVANLSNAGLCDSRCAGAPPRDAGLPSPDARPGLDSAGGGAGGGSNDGTAGTSGSGASDRKPAGDGTETNDSKSSACSFSGWRHGSALSMVLALGLMALSWRRRR